MPTREEIEKLKESWRRDPCWDIEDTEGFSEHHEELKQYHEQCDREYFVAEENRKTEKAMRLGCSVALVEYIERLEMVIANK